ncbi:inositol monophosphatase family protein [Enterococcus sp. CWB-B31]|uniref:inositol monophosphatase family protein n=1 Tax=Enterococcus sp. CWB-B31 TaxID=2885159 RepID=UPI001E2C77EA|nr:inositol monophosphatase family protein [Enterococcus sp. CWB-B31]MCB5955294.1 inositol monophosphatase family protein [Enterococcus sp. CWB-B31]
MKTVNVEQVKNWLMEAGEFIKESLTKTLEVKEKSNRKDLVTNIDEETQQFLIKKIQEVYPKDKILGEEQGCSTIDSLDGRVWIIDPIDGTMNFVIEQENFCIMLGIFEDGIGQLGFIYDVMRSELYWGGKELGVYRNKEKLSAPAPVDLRDGLLGFNAYMYGENVHGAKAVANASMGIRVSGCAGLEMIALLKGSHVGYISNLAPWDYAPGMVLLESFGYQSTTLTGEALSFDGREYFAAAMPENHQKIVAMFKENMTE